MSYKNPYNENRVQWFSPQAILYRLSTRFGSPGGMLGHITAGAAAAVRSTQRSRNHLGIGSAQASGFCIPMIVCCPLTSILRGEGGLYAKGV